MKRSSPLNRLLRFRQLVDGKMGVGNWELGVGGRREFGVRS
uniref:Uncharacterized protein n=1 Tax=Desertifilum tharense IPPAS B-1220 TaxID=1781255 RepID=A0ACD5GVG2_9CYAN